jgi:hypothetical protein
MYKKAYDTASKCVQVFADVMFAGKAQSSRTSRTNCSMRQCFVEVEMFQMMKPLLTFTLLMWTFGRAPNNASKWEIGFKSVA